MGRSNPMTVFCGKRRDLQMSSGQSGLMLVTGWRRRLRNLPKRWHYMPLVFNQG